MFYIGVLKVFYEFKLLLCIILGVLVGLIVCVVLCICKDEEIFVLVEVFFYGDLGVFEGEKDGFFDYI